MYKKNEHMVLTGPEKATCQERLSIIHRDTIMFDEGGKCTETDGVHFDFVDHDPSQPYDSHWHIGVAREDLIKLRDWINEYLEVTI